MGRYVIVMGKGNAYKILVRKSEERDHFGDPVIDGMIMLKWI
jgi:hypothetical protein